MHFGDVGETVQREMVQMRRALHRRPELAFEEEETAQTIIARMEALGLPYTYGGVGEAVVADLRVDPERPTIALRADMDALPGEEATNLPFSSTLDGRVHACGHDAHVAIVAGAAQLLVETPPQVNVRFVFQPAEEKGGGARVVLASGALDGVSAIFGGHVTQHYRVGEIMLAAGAITAQSDRFEIDIHGRGGHGARPHEATDAVVVASVLITTLQTLVSREVDPLYPSVITVGTVRAGTAANVIAETAHLEGSIRSTRDDVRKHLHEGIRRMAKAMGDLHNAELDVRIHSGYPPVVNTLRETELARRAAIATVGQSGVMPMDHPSLGAEDFAYYLENTPGCYVRFGARIDDASFVPLHSPAFDVNEAVLGVGAAFFANVADVAGEYDT